VSTCPICLQGMMQQTEISVTMPEVLRKWEAANGQALKNDVWADYESASDRDVILHRCDLCGFGQFHPILAGTSRFYQAIAEVDYYNRDKWEFEVAATEIEKAGAHSVLDVGSGSGLFLDFLRERLPATALSAYELNKQLLKQLASRGYNTLPVDAALFSSAESAPLRFDAICMLQVLEHVADPNAFLDTFLPLLKPGGLLIITTPNAEGPIRAFPLALTEVPPHHTTRWTEHSFRALFATRGLEFGRLFLEPLPDYLWDSYLPVMWDEPIWPALIFDPLARARGLTDLGERAGFAADAMRAAGISRLQDVPGHTIFVSATTAGSD